MKKRVQQRHDRAEIIKRLIDLAHSGAERPKQLYTVEGRFLSHITCMTSTYYDAAADKELRAVRPDWFGKPKNRSGSLKEAILDFALEGGERRDLPTHLNNALSHYRSERCLSHDEDFVSKIERLRPDWFEATKPQHMRTLLLRHAADGSTPDRSLLTRFTTPSGRWFNPAFNLILRDLRPDWFDTRTDELKHELIRLASQNGKQPTTATTGRTIYYAFRRYTRPSDGQYDEVFAQKLRHIRPDWFAGRAKPSNRA